MSDEAAQTPEEAVKLRGDPPRVMRLSRRALACAHVPAFTANSQFQPQQHQAQSHVVPDLQLWFAKK